MSRLLIVCRHFWPVCNESAYRLASLARVFSQHEIAAHIVTTRWHSRWPASSAFSEMPLTRVLPAPTSPWSEGFFLRNVWNWIEKHSEAFSHIYIDALGLVSSVRLNPALKQKKYMVRFDPYNMLDVDALRKPTASVAWLIRSGHAKFLVSNAHEHRILIGFGINEQHIVRMEPVSVFQRRSSATEKKAARVALKMLSLDFAVPEGMPLVVTLLTGDDYEAENQCLKMLVQELERDRYFRTWVFGTNELVRRHYAYLKDQGVHHDVLLHSPFDDIDLVYDAADLILCPKNRVGRSYYYATAIANGTPTLMAGAVEPLNAENETSLGDCVYNMLTHESTDAELFHRFLDNPTTFEKNADKIYRQFDWNELRMRFLKAWQQMLEP